MAIFGKIPTSKTTGKSARTGSKTSFTDNALVPVLPASVLLSHQKRAKFVDEIANFTRLPRKLFDELYRDAIKAYAEFAQRLHAVKGARYDILGGALDLGLERARNGMEQYRRYLQDNGIYPESLSMQQELWNYVIFSASLLYNCGLLAEHFQIKLFDDARADVGEWLPAQNNMKACAAYYVCEKRMTVSEEIIAPLNIIIAKRLIPAKGFEWICSQRASLETWLQLLASDLDEEDGTKSLFMSLMLWVDNYLVTSDVPGGGAPKQSKQYKIPMLNFNRAPDSGTDNKGGKVSAEQGPNAGAEGADYSGKFPNLGGEFLEWLRFGLANGTINLNTFGADIQVVREGVIMRGNKLAGEFLAANKKKGYSENYTTADVEKAFQQLGVSEPSLSGAAEVKVQAGNDTKQLQNWTLVSDTKSVFAEVKPETQNHFQIYAASRVASHYQWYQQLAQQSTSPGQGQSRF